jgi:integrase
LYRLFPNAFSTSETISGYLANWIVSAWGSRLLNEVKAVDVEDWLGKLKLAPGSKKKIRDIMHLLYEHAIRYEFTDRNPISKVRQDGKRLGTPTRLDVIQLRRLLGALPARERLMVLLDFGTGLRRGELSGLKWEDVNLEERELTPMRSIVQQHIGDLKTESSGKSVPLDKDLIAELLAEEGNTLRCGQRLRLRQREGEREAALLDVQNHAALH